MRNRFFAHPIVRGALAVAGGLLLFYACIWVFWGSFLAVFPPTIEPQRSYGTGTRTDSIIFYDVNTHTEVRREYPRANQGE